MMRIASLLLLAIIGLIGCQQSQPTAQQIIDRTIEQAGGERYTRAQITFDFREHSYGIKRNGGLFEYTRKTYLSSDSTMLDKIHNYGFKRSVNDSMISVTDSMAERYKASVNSVVYFFSLPFGLNDQAVNKKLIGEKTIEGNTYFKIKVWFDEQGGGEDHQDEYFYWIDKASYKVDYLAYSYQIDGGGLRFRKAINERYVKGIRFVDYINYKPTTDTIGLIDTDTAYEQGDLEELSRIENDNVEVSILDTDA